MEIVASDPIQPTGGAGQRPRGDVPQRRPKRRKAPEPDAPDAAEEPGPAEDAPLPDAEPPKRGVNVDIEV